MAGENNTSSSNEKKVQNITIGLVPSSYNYYPNINSDDDIKNYVYFNTLDKFPLGKEIYDRATNVFVNTTLQNNEETFKKLLEELGNLLEIEKKSEELFLERLKIGDNSLNREIGKERNWSELIKNFNEALKNTGVFKQNVEKILKFEEGSEDIDVDISRKLCQTIIKKINDRKSEIFEIEDSNKQDLLLQIIETSFLELYKEDPYKQLGDILEKLQGGHNNIFYTEILKILDIKSLENVIESLKDKDPSDIQIPDEGRKLGFIFEEIEALFQEAVQKSFIVTNTGTTYQKADTVVVRPKKGKNASKNKETIKTKFTEDLLVSIKAKEIKEYQAGRSVRLKNIERVKRFLSDIKNIASDVVFISDKNYNILGDSFKEYGGFSAETPNFVNLDKLLTRKNRNKEILKDLMFILINLSDNTISVKREEKQKLAIEYIARNIAYFLFDDIVLNTKEIKDIKNINRVHIFNLNNIYIPFSILLEGIYESFNNTKTELNNGNNENNEYWKIEINPYKFLPEEDKKIDGKKNDKSVKITYLSRDITTKKDWENYANLAKQKGTVSIHFFTNFVNFIQKTFQDVKI